MNRLRKCFALACAMALPLFASAQTSYNIYFGDNHSHTWYSDGNQDQVPASYPLPVARGITYANAATLIGINRNASPKLCSMRPRTAW